MRWSTYHTASDWLCSSGGGAAILKVEGTKRDLRASTFPNVGVGYKQANNQYWIQWNVLCGCRINKYVIGLYYTNISQRRRKLQHWTKSTKIEIVHTVHVTCGQMRLNNVALCPVYRNILDKLEWYQETDAGICFKKTQSWVSVWENILILCWLSRIFCLSGLMNGKNQQKPSKCRNGPQNRVVGEVGHGGTGIPS